MDPVRTMPPRIRWSDGTDGLEAPELKRDRMVLWTVPSRYEAWVLAQRAALTTRRALAVRAKQVAAWTNTTRRHGWEERHE